MKSMFFSFFKNFFGEQIKIIPFFIISFSQSKIVSRFSTRAREARPASIIPRNISGI